MIPGHEDCKKTEGAVRLNRFLAMCGVGSRRKVESVIASGVVRINGAVAEDPALRVKRSDTVTVDGRYVRPGQKVYLVLNKPAGVVCSVDDQHNRTVMEILPHKYRQMALFPVGRLDKESTGLIILTNDGDFANYLTHPRYGITKEYRVRLDRSLETRDLEKWRKGIFLNGKKVIPVHLERIPGSFDKSLVRITLGEGMKREIRIMASALGYKVTELERTRIGKLKLKRLPPGEIKKFERDELEIKITYGGSL